MVKTEVPVPQGPEEVSSLKAVATTSPPGFPEEAIILEGSHRHAIMGWKKELMSLERFMLKVGARGGGAPESPSRAGGDASPRAVASGILADKISRLHHSGKEYRTSFDQFIDKLFELVL